jgi:hypothetical protein
MPNDHPFLRWAFGYRDDWDAQRRQSHFEGESAPCLMKTLPPIGAHPTLQVATCAITSGNSQRSDTAKMVSRLRALFRSVHGLADSHSVPHATGPLDWATTEAYYAELGQERERRFELDRQAAAARLELERRAAAERYELDRQAAVVRYTAELERIELDALAERQRHAVLLLAAAAARSPPPPPPRRRHECDEHCGTVVTKRGAQPDWCAPGGGHTSRTYRFVDCPLAGRYV